jgi:hypothetical protein
MSRKHRTREETMNIPTIGQIVTVNFDVEKETEDGDIIRQDAGEELEVIGYDPCMTSNGMTPERYLAETGTLELEVNLGDVMVQNMWDRSGCSDYNVSGETAWLSVDDESGFQVVR